MKKRINVKKATEQLVVNQIIVKSPQRKVYDVGDWRNALKSADTGRVKQLYDLFDDILIDGLLADAMDKRIDAVLNSELIFQDKDGREVEEVAVIMDTPDWEELLRQIMYERFYGRCGVELLCTPDTFHVAPIPPKHINLKKRCIIINDSDETGIPYEGDNSLLILGKERNYGLLLKATPYAIYKRGGFGDWSQWVELFGMPQRVGKYNAYDPESRKLLEQAMEEAGSAPYIIIPKEAEVETKSGNNGSGTSYNEFRQACNEEMLITILGQTLTTVQGENGARSLGEVHKEVEEGKNRSDMRFVQRVLNNHVLPMLEARGYPVGGGQFVFPKSAEPLTVSDIVQLSDILPIPQSYLHKKYSIPVPEENEPIARRQPAAFEPIDIEEETEGAATAQPTSTAHTLSDHSFVQRLKRFFALAPTMGATSISTFLTTLSDDTLDKRIIKRVAEGKASYWDTELFEYISKDLLNAIHTAFKRPLNNADFDYSTRDDALTTAMEQNLFHFSAAKTLAEVQQLNQLYRKTKNFEEFTKEAERLCGKFNKAWQKTEYDTALLTAEAAANYQRLKKKCGRYPYWQYVTAGDEKVRDEHKKLDGVTLMHNDPRWDKIYPPNGWKCRCYVVPKLRGEVNDALVEKSQKITDEYMESDEWKDIEATHFDRGGRREDVFNSNQMYVRKFPEKAAKMMNKLKPADWGLNNSSKQLKHDAKEEFIEYKGEPIDFWNSHKIKDDEGNEVLPVTDYGGKEWQMSYSSFKYHTSNIKKTRGFRKMFLNSIHDVISNPDEVWLNYDASEPDKKDNYLNQWHYLKYYKGIAIVCVCKLQNGKMNFLTFYEYERHKNMKKDLRSGFLIYHK